MLIFFFTIIFVAELIITLQIIAIIKKCDKKICEIDNNITKFTPQIEKIFSKLRIPLNKLLLYFNKIETKIKQKKEEYKIIFLKNLISWILLLLLHLSGKKVSSAIDLILAITDFAKEWDKKFNFA